MQPDQPALLSQTVEKFKFSSFKDIFTDALLIELSNRSTEKEIQNITRFLLSVSKEFKLHTMFTSAGVTLLMDTIFLNPDIRDFVLSLSDRFFIEISSDSDEGESEKQDRNFINLVRHLTNGMKFYSKSYLGITPVAINYPPNIYTPKPVLDNLLVSNLEETLKLHNWLIIAAMILLTFPAIESDFTKLSKQN